MLQFGLERPERPRRQLPARHLLRPAPRPRRPGKPGDHARRGQGHRRPDRRAARRERLLPAAVCPPELPHDGATSTAAGRSRCRSTGIIDVTQAHGPDRQQHRLHAGPGPADRGRSTWKRPAAAAAAPSGCGPADAERSTSSSSRRWPRSSTASDVFRITLTAFLDAHTFDTRRVMKCCLAHLLPSGHIVPFCAYNTLYRDGHVPLPPLADACADPRRGGGAHAGRRVMPTAPSYYSLVFMLLALAVFLLVAPHFMPRPAGTGARCRGGTGSALALAGVHRRRPRGQAARSSAPGDRLVESTVAWLVATARRSRPA